MISTYLFDLFEIIYLNAFSKFLNFVHLTFKLNILSNYAKHLKKLVSCYTLSFFTKMYLQKNKNGLKNKLICMELL